MKPMTMNMSRFRKVSQDKDKSVFQQHDTGHTLTVAHKALPREQRNYLNALPLYAADQADPEQQTESLARGGKIGEALNNKQKRNKKSPGQMNLADAFKKHYEGGTPTKPVSQDDDDGSGDDDDDTPAPQASPTAQQPIINVYAGASSPNPTPNASPNVNAVDNQNAQVQGQMPSTSQGAAPQAAQQNAASEAAAAPTSTQQPDGSLADVGNALNQLQGANPGKPELNQASPSPQNSLQGTASLPTDAPQPGVISGYESGLTGLRGAAAASGQLGAQQGATEEQYAKDQAILTQNFKNNFNQASQEMDALKTDVQNGQIDPDHYWKNHSKIATGLGLILAGFNPSGHPNSALQFIQNSINRDTEAQKANLGSKQDLLNHYYQMFGHLNAASDFVNASKQNQVAATLRAQAAKMQDPLQAAKFNQMAGVLQQDTQQKLVPLAAMQAAFQGMSNGIDPSPVLGQLRVVKPEYAKTIEEHQFPTGTWGGGGSTDIPVPPATIDQVAGLSNIMQKSQRLQDFIDTNTIQGKIDPAKRGQGDFLAGELLQYYNQNTNAGVSQSAHEHIQEILANHPNGFLAAYLNDPKLKSLDQSIGDTINTIKSSYHFKPYNNQGSVNTAPPAPQQQQADAPIIKNRNGVPHKKVPGGWAPA